MEPVGKSGGQSDIGKMSEPLNSAEIPAAPQAAIPKPPMPKEIGGPKGPEPTRYGDWEVKGRCTDF